MKRALIIAGAVLVLAACTTEPDQAQRGIRSDTAAFQGTNMPYVAPGWKPGDRNSWEQHLKVRTQMGQNDYAKVN